MKQYRCQFPNCSYETNVRTQIHEHHIKPREHLGSNHKWNKIWLCPSCHHKIYVPNSKGIHSVKNENCVEIICWRNNGAILEYKDSEGIKFHSQSV